MQNQAEHLNLPLCSLQLRYKYVVVIHDKGDEVSAKLKATGQPSGHTNTEMLLLMADPTYLL